MLNELEKFVIDQFLKTSPLANKEIRLDDIKVQERNYSEVGFMTEIEKNSMPKILSSEDNYTGGEIAVIINDNLLTDYVFYIKGGYLEALEGCTFGEDWPDKIASFSIYET